LGHALPNSEGAALSSARYDVARSIEALPPDSRATSRRAALCPAHMQHRFENVVLVGLTHVDAPVVISSRAIEDGIAETMQRLGMPPGTIEQLTGIRERRFYEPGTAPSDAARDAAERLLAVSPVPREDIGVIVSTSVCKDFIEPSVACLVHGGLGLSAGCLNFDVGSACLGFLNGMAIVGDMIERGLVRYGLIVDGEDSRYVVEQTVARLSQQGATSEDFSREFAALTLGSGAAAMLLGHRSLSPDAPRLTGGVFQAATQHNRLCLGQPDRMLTDATGLLHAGVQLGQETFEQARQLLGWSRENLDVLALHQVSRVHTRELCARLHLPEEKAILTFPTLGNTGPAALPIALSMALEQGRVPPGGRVALMGIGSGLNCGMFEVHW
jgi:3-oxoacyl-[acyl-carrier-protein] synthase III